MNNDKRMREQMAWAFPIPFQARSGADILFGDEDNDFISGRLGDCLSRR